MRADTNGDGLLTKEELEATLTLEDLDGATFKSFFHNLDANGDLMLTLEEFCAASELLAPEDVVMWDKKEPFPGLNVQTRTMLFNLLGFLGSRERVSREARQCMPHNFMSEFPSFAHDDCMRQQRLDGLGPVRDYAELSQAGTAAMPAFVQLVRGIVESVGLDPDAEAQHDGKPLPRNETENFGILSIAPLKAQPRCDEKVRNEYGGEYDKIADCVRCSIVVETEAQLVEVARRLRDLSGEGLLLDEVRRQVSLGEHGEDGARAVATAASQGTAEPAQRPQLMSADSAKVLAAAPCRFVVVRFKNRYAQPLFNGYRDALYNLALEVRPGACWQLCEVQLHLAAILSHKKQSHGYYEFFRAFFSGDSGSIERRLAILSQVSSVARRWQPRKVADGLASDVN